MSIELNKETGLFELLCDNCDNVIESEVDEDSNPDAYCEDCQAEMEDEKEEVPPDEDLS